MIYEKEQKSITSDNQQLDSDMNVTTNNDSVDTVSNIKESDDSVLYDNMIFPS